MRLFQATCYQIKLVQLDKIGCRSMQIDYIDQQIAERVQIKAITYFPKRKVGHPPNYNNANKHTMETHQQQPSKRASYKTIQTNKKQFEQMPPLIYQLGSHQECALVKNRGDYPISAIGVVRSIFNNHETKQALGCLIGQNLVLTSASAILAYNEDKQQKCSEVWYIPINMHIDNCKGFRSKRTIIADQLQDLDQNDPQFNYKHLLHGVALIQLQEDIGKYFGTLGYDFEARMFKQWKSAQSIKLIAYEYKYPNLIKHSTKVYNNQKIINNNATTKSRKAQHFWRHKVPIESISEGSPLIEEKDGYYNVRGVQLRSHQFNLALKLKSHLYQSLQKHFESKLAVYNLKRQNINEQQWQHYFEAIKTHSNAIQNNLIRLDLKQNLVRNLGCKYLMRALFKNIHTLVLQGNQLAADACYYLANTQFKYLQKLDLSHNKIGDKGCEYLMGGNWPSLRKLWLNQNEIGHAGCSYISKTNWIIPLQHLYLNRNYIRSIGCNFVAKVDWHSLTHLDLNHNNIGTQGCKYLSKIQCQNMTTLFLTHNKIESPAIIHFSKAKWRNLATLHLSYNRIGIEGAKKCIRCEWKKGLTIHLYRNQINYLGYVWMNALSQSKWMIFY